MNAAPKRNMKTPAAFVGKRIDANKWIIPTGWHCCPDTGRLQADMPEASDEDDSANVLEDEIACTVHRIRQNQEAAERAAAAISELKECLEVLLKQRGTNWSDEDGYARLAAPSVRVNYRREELDTLILQDPLRYAWLTGYRKESVIAGRVAVR